MSAPTPAADVVVDHEFMIIGAGVSGLYMLHRLRELGEDVLVLESADDLGGTWFENRYPGCRFDSESYTYGYSFSEDLLNEWDWSELFAPREETLRYLNFVADRLELRQDIEFRSTVSSASFDDAFSTWRVTTADGRTRTCRFLITAMGNLTVPTVPNIPGRDTFRGIATHTHDWPHEGVEIAGKRVGVIGTGATGVQVISSIPDQVDSLTVFQRRPNWCAPLHNRPIAKDEMAEIRSRFASIFERCDETPGGFIHGPIRTRFKEATPEERRAVWEDLYASPGFGIWLGNYPEVLTDETANAELSAFIADKVRERVHDPITAEKLIPKDHGFGVQRVPMETNYFEAYNRENVELVDVAASPIVEITPSGIRTTEGDYELDVIVFATGYDAITGAFDKIDFQGSNGVRLSDRWADGPRTWLGVQTAEFPNLFMLTGPLSASASTNFPRAIDTGVNWVTDLIKHVKHEGWTRVETSKDAEDRWYEIIKDSYDRLLIRNARSWFTGYNSNIAGRDKTRYLMYLGGGPRYRSFLSDVVSNGYDGFTFAREFADAPHPA